MKLIGNESGNSPCSTPIEHLDSSVILQTSWPDFIKLEKERYNTTAHPGHIVTKGYVLTSNNSI